MKWLMFAVALSGFVGPLVWMLADAAGSREPFIWVSYAVAAVFLWMGARYRDE